jgi:hypothetical protein
MKKLRNITVLHIVLLILAILVWSAIFSITARAQMHLNVGVVDIEDRLGGSTMTWNTGYTHFFGDIGGGANVRYTGIRGDGYYGGELLAKYRFDEQRYRFDAGLGGGYNFNEGDVYPVATIRNSFKLGDGTWLNLDFDNTYRNSKDVLRSGWRLETYLMIGVSLDVDSIGRNVYRKLKTVF